MIEEPTPIITRRLYLYREVPIAIVERNEITNTLRYTFRYVKGLGKRLSITLDFGFKDDSTLIKDEETFITLFSNLTIIMSKLVACYNENYVGPYGIRFVSTKILSRGNVFEVEVYGDDKDFCDWSLILVPKALAYGGVRGEWIYKRLARGFYEDGLIWYLVKEGRVPRNSLPPYIADEQAYYWPRGDVLRESLYRWLQYGDLIAFHIYLEVITQIIRQMTPRGGLVIPFITAAMWRNIFGSPQQLYSFEALYRAYQLTGVEAFRDAALKALECYVTQPPECLGYYRVDERGGIFFRWGSYHYLSTEHDKRENLGVLNTHLMGVVALLEGWVLEKCSWCKHYALMGVQGVKSLINEFMRGDGYLHYGLYTKNRFGVDEDVKRPDLIGYHTLSTRLLLRIANILRDEELFSYASKALRHSLNKFFNRFKGIGAELLRCLVEYYRWYRDSQILRIIERVVVDGNISSLFLGYTLDELDNLSAIPPAIYLRAGQASMLLLNTSNNSYLYYVYSFSPNAVVVEERMLPSGRTIKPLNVECKVLGDEDEGACSVSKMEKGFEVSVHQQTSILLRIHAEEA